MGIFLFFPKKNLGGRFQIVLDLENNGNTLGLSSNPLISSLGNSLTQGNLQTQVGILQSPSVLMPIFEFVKSKNIASDNNGSFLGWKKKKVLIKLKKNTQILDISYKDTDKEIILPVLEKMSQSYQKYSGISKKKLLANSRIF